MKARVFAASLTLALLTLTAFRVNGPFGATLAAQADPDEVKIRALMQRLERAAQQNDETAYLALLAGSADRAAASRFAASEFFSGINRVVVQERDRQPLPGSLPGNGYSLTVDAFMESGDKGRIATWQLEVKRLDNDWRITGQSTVSSVENLYRLSVTPTKQYDARNFVVLAEDIELTLVEGSVFQIDTDQGITGLVLLGHGELRFHPTPETEKGQVRIFSGSDAVESRFDAAYLRFGNVDFHTDRSVLKERPVDPRELKRAEQIFREESVKSFAIDLADLTRDIWSLLPGDADFLAEIRTRRFDTLTYAKSANEAEDISFFERRRRKNIAVYASRDKLATRGRFYNEDDLAPIDILDYEIDVTAIPERLWIDGNVTMRLRVNAPSLAQITLRLADSLVVRSISSREYGRLLSLRVTNQNTLLVNLPVQLVQDAEITLNVVYSGRLPPQSPDRETIALGQQQPALPEFDDPAMPKPEVYFLYSNRSYWYPQSPVTDYATATMQISVPSIYSVVASGEPTSDSPRLQPGRDPQSSRKVYLYGAERPLRYLAFVASKLTRADRWTVAFDPDGSKKPATSSPHAHAADDGPYEKLDLIVDANPRLTGRGKELAERSADIIQFYESIVGDSPFSTFSLALVEAILPGGHSPGFMAVLNQPMAFTGVSWRNDPAAFANYPEFFVAHEVAHQWWGQAVGWRNYHEQWISEGFAQYFAALYAQKFRGDEVFSGVMRQMRRWALEQSDQGPIYLGYRVGHIKDDGRAFRAIVYNKGAVVLHMLRQLLGDDRFFAGLRTFYTDSRFTKAGSDDFREAMEKASDQDLGRFFEQWVYGTTLPKLALTYRLEPDPASGSQSMVVKIEQSGEVFDVPVVVTLQYADRKTDILIPVHEQITEKRIPLEGSLRSAEISRDDGPLAEVVKN